MSENDVLETGVDEEVVLSDAELLQDFINVLKNKQKSLFNLWRAKQIVELEEELAKWYDAAGNKIEPTPEKTELTIQFSPEEVLNAEGWWTAYPKGYGELPDWIGDYTDPEEGLDLSCSRSNGCFLIRNKQETAEAFLAHSERIAKEVGTTRRLIKMMGYMLKDWRYMFPTMNLKGTGTFRVLMDYALEPEVPFNEDEKRVFRWMFSRYHFNGSAMLGTKWQTANVQYRPEEKNPKDRQPVDPSGKHRCITVVNHPQWVLPATMEIYNTGIFKYNAWDSARRLARDIDKGVKARVPGYETIKEMTGESTPMKQFWDEFEPSRADKRPQFYAGSELRRSGVLKYDSET